MGKNEHNLEAAKQDGRKEFANEVRMTIQASMAAGESDTETLDKVKVQVDAEI